MTRSRSETSQHQLQHSDMETGTEQDSVFEQFRKFVRFWKDGRKASFKIECEDGEAFMNLSACLKSSRKTRHSPSKIRRNKLRAEFYRKKKQEICSDAEQLHEQCDVDNEDSLQIYPDLNANEVDSYQLCFLDEEDCDSCALSCSSSRPENESSFSDSDENEIERTPENSFADQCTAGPTVHCSTEENSLEQVIEFEEEIQHKDEVNIDFEEDEEQDNEDHIVNFVDVVMCEHYIEMLNSGSFYKTVKGFLKNEKSSNAPAPSTLFERYIQDPVTSDRRFFKVNYGFEEFGLLKQYCQTWDFRYFRDEYWIYDMLQEMKQRYENKGPLWLDFPKLEE